MARVCIITSVHRPFDHRIFHKQARSLAAAGHEVTLVAPAEFDGRHVDGVTVLGVPRARRRLARPVTWLRLMRQVVRLSPDVVHFHDPELLLPAAVLKATIGRNILFIYDVHEYLVDSVLDKTWLPPWSRAGMAWLVQRLERGLARSVSGIVCVVEDQLPLYETLHCPKVIVHNYPAVADFVGAQQPDEYEPGQFRLVYIGSLYERRGTWTMIEAFRDIARQVPNAHLFLGGSYDDPSFEQRIMRFIAEEGLESRVSLLGWVPHQHLKNYLAFADCVWMPGRLTAQYSHRGLSTKGYEAMICGVPIVSADLPARREFIEPSGGGVLVEPEDPKAHAEAIVWLSQHPEQRREMGARGRSWVLERFVWEQEGKVLLHFYQQILADGKKG